MKKQKASDFNIGACTAFRRRATTATLLWTLTIAAHVCPAAANPVETKSAQPTSPPAAAMQPDDGANDTDAAQSGPTLTLGDFVNSALGVNTGLIASRQRLDKANELIAQVNAQGRPQLRLDANDTYSTFPTGAPSLPSLSIQNPFLPGGGVIPTVIDIGANFPSGYVGFGGTGSANGFALTPGEVPSTPAMPAVPSASPSGAPGPTAPAAASPMPGHADSDAYSGRKSVGSRDAVSTAVALPALAAYFTDHPPVGAAGSDPVESTAFPEGQHTAAMSIPSVVQPGDPSEVGNAATGGHSTTAASTHPNGYAARVSVIQYLDVFRVLSAERAAVRDYRDFYALDVDRLENETALAAKNLYFNALLAQGQVNTLEEQVKYAQENADMAASRFRNKVVSKLDVLTAQTALAAAQQSLIAGENQRDLAQANLGYLLGTPVTSYSLVSPPLPPLDTTVDVASATATALAARPELKQAQHNIDEASKIIGITGDALKPAFGLIATGDETSTESTTQPQSYGGIGAMMFFPFEDGGFTRSRVRSAKTDFQTQQLALEQLKLAVGLEVKQSGLNIHNAQAEVASAQTALTSSQEAVRIAQERYKAGFGTFLDVLNSLAQLATAETNLSVAEFFYQTSLAQFVRTMGGR